MLRSSRLRCLSGWFSRVCLCRLEMADAMSEVERWAVEMARSRWVDWTGWVRVQRMYFPKSERWMKGIAEEGSVWSDGRGEDTGE